MLKKLNLGCGNDIRKGWLNVDRESMLGVDFLADLSRPGCLADLPENHFEDIEMSHILEHIPEPLPLLEEIWRVAAPNANLYIKVPHGAHDMAFADPQHVRQYFPASFQFFSQPAYKRADYGYRGDWETVEVSLLIDPMAPADLPREVLEHMIGHSRNFVWELHAKLQAIKPRRATFEPFTFNPNIVIRRLAK